MTIETIDKSLREVAKVKARKDEDNFMRDLSDLVKKATGDGWKVISFQTSASKLPITFTVAAYIPQCPALVAIVEVYRARREECHYKQLKGVLVAQASAVLGD